MEKTRQNQNESITIDKSELPKPCTRRGPGRGIGQKRLTQQRLRQLNTIFSNLQQIRDFLDQQGHLIINESGSLLASQAHQDLDCLVQLLEDFLWILNCAIAKHGGNPKLF